LTHRAIVIQYLNFKKEVLRILYYSYVDLMITLKISFCFFGINKDTHINIFLIN